MLVKLIILIQQKHLENKKIKSNISFDNFEYKCEYNIENNKGIIDETFNFNNNSIRKKYSYIKFRFK